MTAAATAWSVILPKIATLIYAGRRPVQMTLTGGTTLTAICSTYADGSASAYKYDGCQLMILKAAGAAPEGSFGQISTGGFTPASGTFTFTPAMTTTATGQTALLFYDGLGYEDFLNAANRVVDATYWPRYTAMSLVADGDMETPLVANWTAVAGGTFAKTSLDGQVYTGKAALDLTVTALGDGVQSASVAVASPEQCYVSVQVLLSDPTKSCTVELYDVSNSATLSAPITVAASDWTEVRFPVRLTGSTKNVAVRVKSMATGTWHIYIDYVQILTNGHRTIPLPSQILNEELLDGIMYPSSSFPIGGYLFKPGPLDADMPFATSRNYGSVVAAHVDVQASDWRPLFWRYRQKDIGFAAATGILQLAATTFADVDAIIYGTAAELARNILDRPGMGQHELPKWQAKYSQWGMRYGQILEAIGMAEPDYPRNVRAVMIP